MSKDDAEPSAPSGGSARLPNAIERRATREEAVKYLDDMPLGRCHDCKWFVKHAGLTASEVQWTDGTVIGPILSLRGECHRRSPAGITDDGEGTALWPCVNSGNFCGEQEQVLDKARGLDYTME